MSYEYIDHLREYMKERVARHIQYHRDSLPPEIQDLPDDRIVALIEDFATPILRRMEDDAIDAAIAKAASLIRYSKKGERHGRQNTTH